MSHRRTVIEPAEGLTVLVGPNNCGKSAVVVALQCLNTCDNRSAPFIRHDQKEARVIVDTAEGGRIEWIRGKNYTNYKINGREMTRARRPEDLDEHLRLAEVQSEDGKRTFDLHFAEQKNPIFLLNESGAAAATFFAASSDAAYLVQMQSLLKRRESETRTQKRDLEARIDRQRKQLGAFEDLGEIEVAVRDVSTRHHELQRAYELRAEMGRVMMGLEDAALDYEACALELEGLTALSPPPEMPDVLPLAGLVSRLEESERTAAGAGERMAGMTALFPPPDLTDTQPFAESIRLMEAKARRVAILGEKTAISETAAKPPEQEEPTALREIVGAFDSRVADVDRARRLAAQIEEELATAKVSLEAFLEANPTCPVCGTRLSAEKLMEHVHEVPA